MLYLILGFVLMAACAGTILWMKKRQARLRELITRLRRSDMYAGVYALFREAGEGHVEQVTLTAEEVVISMLHPDGRQLRYVFDDHGTDPLEADVLWALAQAAPIDLPCLRDACYYTFRCEKRPLPAGGSSRCYQYNIRKERKDYLLHAIREKNRQICH